MAHMCTQAVTFMQTLLNAPMQVMEWAVLFWEGVLYLELGVCVSMDWGCPMRQEPSTELGNSCLCGTGTHSLGRGRE